jgi:hypothetical protein
VLLLVLLLVRNLLGLTSFGELLGVLRLLARGLLAAYSARSVSELLALVPQLTRSPPPPNLDSVGDASLLLASSDSERARKYNPSPRKYTEADISRLGLELKLDQIVGETLLASASIAATCGRYFD